MTLFADDKARLETLVVVRTGFGDQDIAGDVAEADLADLLDGGLVIAVDGGGRSLLDERRKEPSDEGGGPVETGVEKHGGDNGFKGVGQERGFHPAARGLFPAAEEEEFPEPESPGHLGQRLLVYDGGAQFRELSLGIVGEFLHQHIGDGQLQDCIAQEFEPLVVLEGEGGILVDERPVGEGVLQKADVRETVAEALLQLPQALHPLLIHHRLKSPIIVFVSHESPLR